MARVIVWPVETCAAGITNWAARLSADSMTTWPLAVFSDWTAPNMASVPCALPENHTLPEPLAL